MADIANHGWTAVPVELSTHLNADTIKSNPPKAIPKEHFLAPATPLISSLTKYAQTELPRPTFHHSMRVYAWALALMDHLPTPFLHISQETILLACLLHDIGSTPQNMHSTHLSFEFHGGILAHGELSRQDPPCPAPQREAVIEAIIRHQDLGSSGNIHALGALMQIATIVDNLGEVPAGSAKGGEQKLKATDLIHESVLREVNEEFPRLNWSGCKGCVFAETVREEGRVKPWSHTSKLGFQEFAGGIEGNAVMAYE